MGRCSGLPVSGTGTVLSSSTLYAMVPLVVLLFLPFVKIITTSLTLGSGGSGGVFAPGLTIGAATGGAVGMIFHILYPAVIPLGTVPVFCIVGMIALFGSIANAPIAVLIMVVEMMGNFSLLVPAMGGVGMAYLITGGRSIYREQVPTKAQSEAHRHEYGKRVLEQILVAEAMIPREMVVTLSPDDPVSTAVDLIDRTSHTGFPVLEDGRLVGIITMTDVRRVQHANDLSISVRDAMTRKPVVITPEDTMENALKIMTFHTIHHLPVARPGDPEQLAGFLTRTDLMKIYARACRFM